MVQRSLPERIAIVGGGLGGLACARTLATSGATVCVFDKGRGPGGRMSTRRFGELAFDHGAQYFTARDPGFVAEVAGWEERGVIARWEPRLVAIEGAEASPVGGSDVRWVGVPGMSSLVRHLAEGIEVRFRTRVVALERQQKRWRLETEDGPVAGLWDAVVVNAPAAQAAELLEVAPHLAERARSVRMTPCVAAMVAFSEPPELDFDAAFVNEDAELAWIADNASKPGRPATQAWTLHATPSWSEAHFEAPREIQADALLGSFARVVGSALPPVTHLDAHRWKFALPPAPLEEACLVDGERLLLACGDWCGGPRVEGAWKSGIAAARRLMTPAGGDPR